MLSSKFVHRWDQEEIMDDLNFAGEEMDQALRELETINKWLGGNAVTLSGLNKLKQSFPEKHAFSLVDMGCGGGDMLRLIADWGRKKKLQLKLTGVDANPYIIEYARKNTKTYPEIDYQVANVFDKDLQIQPFDVVTSTLFTHHFSQSQLSVLIPNWIDQASMGVVLNDLHRHWLAYYSIIGITKIMSKSHMVKNDGPISVLRAFSKQDLEQLLVAHNINHYMLHWRWAFRWLLVIPSC